VDVLYGLLFDRGGVKIETAPRPRGRRWRLFRRHRAGFADRWANAAMCTCSIRCRGVRSCANNSR
jgi:hypothetical protein